MYNQLLSLKVLHGANARARVPEDVVHLNDIILQEPPNV